MGCFVPLYNRVGQGGYEIAVVYSAAAEVVTESEFVEEHLAAEEVVAESGFGNAMFGGGGGGGKGIRVRGDSLLGGCSGRIGISVASFSSISGGGDGW